MDKKPNQAAAEYSILRTVNLQAVSTWMLQTVIDRLKKAEKEILVELLDIDPTAATSPQQRNDRLEKLIAAIREIIRKAYAEILDRQSDSFDELADIEEEKQRKQLGLIFGGKFRKAKTGDIASLIIMGATLQDWFEKQAGDLVFKYQTQLTHGMALNESLAHLTRRVKGFAGKDETGKVEVNPRPLDAAIANAETLLRTSTEAVAQEIDSRVIEKAPKTIRPGWQSIAVIDNRTTQICLTYAWKIWDKDLKPVGSSLKFLPVPRHWNCRSSIIMIVLDEDPAAEFSFDDWLSQISEKDRTRIFGATQMKLYNAGKISAAQLVRQQERALSLDDYRKDNESL